MPPDLLHKHPQSADLIRIIAENEAFVLSDPTTRATLQKAYAASSALYFRGQPAFDDILAEITKWSPKL